MTLAESMIRAPFARPVRGLCTTRFGGVGRRPFDSLNLGAGVGDDPADVETNRARLEALLPARPCWLRQVHGSRVIHLDEWVAGIEADAAWTDRPGQVACVLAADCLPILVAERGGGCCAVIHAGWRGLAAGVIARTIGELPADPARLQAWIGPRICRDHYEVGPEVRAALNESESAFEPVRPGHWLADLPRIAERQLRDAGAGQVTDSGACTADESRFFSHRRDKRTGRMVACIWLQYRSP